MSERYKVPDNIQKMVDNNHATNEMRNEFRAQLLLFIDHGLDGKEKRWKELSQKDVAEILEGVAQDIKSLPLREEQARREAFRSKQP